MTRLKCSVHNCTYQREDCCARGNIQVEGADAHENCETRCGSFRERQECGCNSTSEPPKMSDIACEVSNCKFNSECRCTAEDILVAGSHAHTSSETECASFVCCR